jgi:hypothetical protein
MSEPIHIISLGAGVQSSTMALMAAEGEITPMPKYAIFADTHAEPKGVYRWLDWLEAQLPFPVIRVSNGSLTAASLTVKVNRKTGKGYYSNMIPAFVQNKDGSGGKVERHCTYNHKIVPIIQQYRKAVTKEAWAEWRAKHRTALKAFRKWRKAKKDAKPPFPHEAWKELQSDPLVIQSIGISLDEVTRMKPSREPWALHRWPLVDLRMSRHDCLLWMERRGFPKPPRSACVYCPFHSDAEWLRLKREEPEAFSDAVVFEKQLQQLHSSINMPGKIKGIPFLHTSLRPLSEVEFKSSDNHANINLFNNECEGMCGV